MVSTSKPALGPWYLLCSCLFTLTLSLCTADFKNVSIVGHYIKDRTKNAQVSDCSRLKMWIISKPHPPLLPAGIACLYMLQFACCDTLPQVSLLACLSTSVLPDVCTHLPAVRNHLPAQQHV
jgi:hypothetical protein